ncbi:MAG: Ig-like domain-containing protein [Acidobacteriota bacterium]
MRRTITLLIGVVALIAGALAYQQWQLAAQRTQAEGLIAQAGTMIRGIEERSDYQQLRREFFGAWEDLDAARRLFDDGSFGESVTRAESCISVLRQAIGASEEDSGDRGRFLSVTGNVEYRRGERGAWKRARRGDSLNPGDWVKTAATGSAHILSPDGTEYTLRANTMLHLNVQTNRFGRSEQVAEMQFGWVELNTDQAPSQVRTPKSQANIRKSSEAMVAYDRERSTSTFAAYRGGVEVVAENGQTQNLNALEQVVQVGDLLSNPSSLPGRPRLLSPGNDWDVDLQGGDLRLSWRPVAGAANYALRVSRSELFASSLIEDNRRTKTSARLGLRSEGVFFWQVAAVAEDGVRGPWSDPRGFRVSQRRGSSAEDTTPPALRIEDVQTYGSLLIVNGRTESGATVAINGEAASVNADGSFSKTLQMRQEGFAFVELTAEDAAGNTSHEQRRVFIGSTY